MKFNVIFFSVIYSLILKLNTQQSSYYNYANYVPEAIYDLSPIPSGSSYSSNNTCVSYTDLINYNYTDLVQNLAFYQKVFPENYCYGLLTYNISREDFFDIVNKNLSKHYLNSYLNHSRRVL